MSTPIEAFKAGDLPVDTVIIILYTFKMIRERPEDLVQPLLPRQAAQN
jgi:hypothetical protein